MRNRVRIVRQKNRNKFLTDENRKRITKKQEAQSKQYASNNVKLPKKTNFKKMGTTKNTNDDVKNEIKT